MRVTIYDTEIMCGAEQSQVITTDKEIVFCFEDEIDENGDRIGHILSIEELKNILQNLRMIN